MGDYGRLTRTMGLEAAEGSAKAARVDVAAAGDVHWPWLAAGRRRGLSAP